MALGAGLPGALAAGPPGAPPGGAPPRPAIPPGAKAVGLINLAIKVLMTYLTVEPDQEEKAKVTQCLHVLQQVLAKDQADARGGGPAPSGPPRPPGL